MEEYWEAPGVVERHEVGFAGVELEVHDLEYPDLLLSHLRALYPLSQRRGRYCWVNQY